MHSVKYLMTSHNYFVMSCGETWNVSKTASNIFLLEEHLNLVNNLSFLWKGILNNGNHKLIFHTVSFPDSNYTFIKLFLFSILHYIILIFTYSLHVKSSFISLRSRKSEKKGQVHRISFDIFHFLTTGSQCLGGVICLCSVSQTVSHKLSCSYSSLFIKMMRDLQLPAMKCIPSFTNVAMKTKRQHDKILLLWIMGQITQKSLKCALY